MHPRVSDRPMSENIVDHMWELELCLRTQKGVRCSFSRRPCPTKLMTSLSEQTSLSVVQGEIERCSTLSMETFRDPFRSMRYIHKVCAWSQYENPIWVYINGNVSDPLVIPATLYLMISNGTQNRSLKVIPNSRPRFQNRVLRQYLDTIFQTMHDMYIWFQPSNCWFIPYLSQAKGNYKKLPFGHTWKADINSRGLP